MKTYGELVDGSKTLLKDGFATTVIVIRHEDHSYDSTTGKCKICGKRCGHTDVDSKTGVCPTCKFQFTASISGVSGIATKYFDNVKTAFSTADSVQLKGCTITIYKDCELTDTVAMHKNENINFNLGGHTIGIANAILIGSKNVTLTGGGKFNGEIQVCTGATLINGVNDTNDSKAVSIKKLCVEGVDTTYIELYGGAYDSLIIYGDMADVAIYGGSFGEIKSESETSINVGSLLAKTVRL